jgi:rubrerythrin
MILTEKEATSIQDLQTQEETCIKKYEKYEQQAHDTELKSLFQRLKKEEQTHYDSLGQVLKGSVPSCNCNDSDGKDYQPKRTYDQMTNSEEKKEDCFLATDCIGTEKLVSSEYNTNVFTCSDSEVRKLLADIQIEEQNHAEMLYKYKQVNGMS